MTAGIYLIRNSVDKRVYVGMSKNLSDRIARHRRYLKKGNHDNKQLQEMFNRYGDIFSYEILHQGEYTLDELYEMEKQEIERHRAFTAGFNYTLGGAGSEGFKHTQESSEKMSETRKVTFLGEGNPFYGKSHSEETKQTIREATSKRMAGVPKSKEQKHKMSLSSPRNKAISIDGVQYRSITAAAEITGIKRETISYRVRSDKFKNYRRE
jgi:group I intron endonuclease